MTYRSKPTYLEIASSACSKGDGLRALAVELGVDLADTVFFGDNHNDVSAFEVAGTAVAVANAVDPALDAARSSPGTTARTASPSTSRSGWRVAERRSPGAVRGTGLEPITLRLAWTTTGRRTDAGNRARRSAVG